VPAPICRPGRGAAAPEANLEKSIPALFLLEQSKIANQEAGQIVGIIIRLLVWGSETLPEMASPTNIQK
jgi:hypothetical protein